MKEAETVKNGFVKQDCIIGDASVRCKLVLWEENVDSLEEDISYKLSGLVVCTNNGKNICLYQEIAALILKLLVILVLRRKRKKRKKGR